MELTSISPRPHSEKRVFECAKCHFIETKIACDPLNSDKVRRLMKGIIPPT